MKENREIVTVEDAVNASGPALVAYFNAHSPKPVKKFSDRATAIKRVVALMKQNASSGKKRPAEPAQAPAIPKVAADGSSRRHVLSEKQRVSWLDPEVREARCERSAVSVDGEDFKSVRAAFLELGLPMGKHIKFRGELKEQGKMTAFGHEWEIVPLNY